jgi:hypothetical protein
MFEKTELEELFIQGKKAIVIYSDKLLREYAEQYVESSLSSCRNGDVILRYRKYSTLKNGQVTRGRHVLRYFIRDHKTGKELKILVDEKAVS